MCLGNPRKKYFEEIEPSDWSLIIMSFLNWRSKFTDFSEKKFKHSAWKSLLKDITSSSLYGDSAVKKAQLNLLYSMQCASQQKHGILLNPAQLRHVGQRQALFLHTTVPTVQFSWCTNDENDEHTIQRLI